MVDTHIDMCLCSNNTCQKTGEAQLCNMVIGEEITNDIQDYIQESSIARRSKRQAEDDWSAIDYDPNTSNEEVCYFTMLAEVVF